MRKTQEQFIKEVTELWKNKYDFSQSIYVTRKTKIDVICPIHGLFQIAPGSLLEGHGCQKCGRLRGKHKQSKTTEQFIKDAIKVHGDRYDYSKVEYNNYKNKVVIICPKHGEFLQSPNDHLGGSGCPKCSNSSGEKMVRLFLEENNIEYIQEKSFEGCKYKAPLRFDFYLPKHNMCIEFQGIQHYKPISLFNKHESFEVRQLRDNIKRQYCKEHGILLLEIKYDQNVPGALQLLI